MYKTAEAKVFQEEIAYSYNGPYFENDLQAEIEFARNPIIDTDNAVKLVLDALEGVAFKNDSKVASISVRRYKCKKGDDWLTVRLTAM